MTAIMSLEEADKGTRFRWLNPETALYLGYCFHVASDDTAKGTAVRDLAELETKRVVALSATPGSRDDHFLTEVRSAMVSYAGAIGRHKRVFFEAMAYAKQEHLDRQQRIVDGMGFTAVNAAFMKYGMLAVVFAIGFSLARILAPFIPDKISDETGNAPPSILLGFVFVVLSRFVTMGWDYYRQTHINNRYHVRQELAWAHYSRSRLNEYRQHLYDLTEMWNAYTGEEYHVVSSIEVVLEDDDRMRRELALQRKRLDEWGFLGDFQNDIASALRRLSRRPGSKGKST